MASVQKYLQCTTNKPEWRQGVCIDGGPDFRWGWGCTGTGPCTRFS